MTSTAASAPNARPAPASIVSPENQSVTFVELFFDLVFVFAVTQVVHLLHDGVAWATVGRSVLVFWMVWWAWTQFTWALNAADTTHPLIQLGTLAATAVAFFMAVALPHAFEGRALWFALPYVLVRGTGLAMYSWVARATSPAQHAAVRTFFLLSTGGLAAVGVGAFLPGSAQYWAWGIGILLDVVAAGVGGRLEGWSLHPAHFAERHGLFVIIALGECLIVTAAAVTGAEWTSSLLIVGVLAVAGTCSLWWTYFPRAKPKLDHALESLEGAALSRMARDAFSLIHFPMLMGIILYGAAVAEAVAHPDEPLAPQWRWALASGLVLYVGGMALATWRCLGRLPVARVALTAATAAAIVALSGPPALSLTVALVGVGAVAAAEQREEAQPVR